MVAEGERLVEETDVLKAVVSSGYGLLCSVQAFPGLGQAFTLNLRLKDFVIVYIG